MSDDTKNTIELINSGKLPSIEKNSLCSGLDFSQRYLTTVKFGIEKLKEDINKKQNDNSNK